MTTILKYPKSVWYIIGNEFCERFSYFGLKAVLVLFFTTIQEYDHDTSTIIFHMFLVCAYLSPLFGAIIADSYWGKYKTIFILSIVHAIGNILVAVASFVTSISLNFQRLFTIVGLLLTSIGAGGIKPCVSSFGGDQFVVPDQEDHLRKFFSVFYFTINAGSLLSTFITPELRKSVQCFGKDSCFPLAFGVPAILMLISIVFFVSGKHLYKIKKPVSSIITTSIGCMSYALKKKITASSNETKRKDWLEYADDKYNTHKISELRSALDVMYLLIPVPLFYTLFDQQGSRWTLQGTLMNGKIEFLNWSIKPDQMHLINPLFVLIFIPLFNGVVYPILYKIGINTPLKKVTLGGIFAASSFVCSAVVQHIIIAIFQYGLLVWGGLNENAVRPLILFQRKIIRICLGRNNLIGSTGENFKVLNVLPVESVYKKGHPLLLPSNEGQLRIYNNFDCRVAMSGSLVGNFSFEPLDVLYINYSSAVFNETDVLSIEVNPKCQLKTGTLKQRVFIVQGRVSSYLLTSKNNDEIELKNLNELRKLRSGNSNLRISYSDNLSGKSITLRNTNNKLSDINNFQAVLLNKNTNHEIPVGTYDIYLDNEHILKKIDLLPASVNELIFHQRFNRTNAKLITLENGKYIHILWQVPQTLLITVAEVMIIVTLLEFTFTQAPLSMKSFISAANLCTQAVGNLLIVIISKMKLFENQVHEYIFYVILVVLGVIIFMLMSAKYKYKSVTDNQSQNER